MNVIVNGEKKTIENGTAVSQMVEQTVGQDTGRGIAVALNGTVVPRSEWATTQLESDDRIEILTAVAGG